MDTREKLLNTIDECSRIIAECDEQLPNNQTLTFDNMPTDVVLAVRRMCELVQVLARIQQLHLCARDGVPIVYVDESVKSNV